MAHSPAAVINAESVNTSAHCGAESGTVPNTRIRAGKVIAASKLGKIKTTCQMILIIVSILFNIPVLSTWYMIAMSAIVVAITLLSAVDYFVRNRKVFVTK